ncbi:MULTISPECIES: hypothetical protein [Vibrio]|uniref:Uncharacterized protein n=2 Tax=Vibrio TaxID=662 RepID=A0A7X4LM84_9VIBR|nr:MULTISPECIES: hypothetical protein [Vibrio]MBF9003010.1 hypothetical protein [Vibrio nitrifigilis]MZI94547.1 hypothetical protein [Vibrio eleionomae]
MHHSDIVVSRHNNQEQTQQQPQTKTKLSSAYKAERESLETIEIELNRSKIVMVDETGKIIKFPLSQEH